MKIFGFEIEFDKDELRKKIEAGHEGNVKGYICVVDGPSLTRSHTNVEFMQVLQQAYANTCDGGSIAAMASRLTQTKLHTFTGPEIFAEYITNTHFQQIIVGNTEQKFQNVMRKISDNGVPTSHIHYIPLPFTTLNDFDYKGIAQNIKKLNADIIWVSLGAPKQEFFMQRLLPYLDRGVMLGIGAALAFYLNELKDYNFRIGEFRMNWVFRLFTEPKKQFARVMSIIKVYPRIYFNEKKRLSNNRTISITH